MRVKNGKDKCTASKCASSTIITIFLILLCSILVTFSVIFFWGDFSISGLLEAALPAIYVIGSVLVFSFLVFLILFISVRCCNNSISGIAFSIVLAVLCCMIVTTSSGVIGYDYYHFVNNPEESEVHGTIVDEVVHYAVNATEDWISFQNLHHCCGFGNIEEIKTGEECLKAEPADCYTLFYNQYSLFYTIIAGEFVLFALYHIIVLFGLLVRLCKNGLNKTEDKDSLLDN